MSSFAHGLDKMHLALMECHYAAIKKYVDAFKIATFHAACKQGLPPAIAKQMAEEIGDNMEIMMIQTTNSEADALIRKAL